MVEAHQKLTKIGNSFGFIVPKALIQFGVLRKGELYKIRIESIKTEKPLNTKAIQSGTIPSYIHCLNSKNLVLEGSEYIIIKGSAFGKPYTLFLQRESIEEIMDNQ